VVAVGDICCSSQGMSSNKYPQRTSSISEFVSYFLLILENNSRTYFSAGWVLTYSQMMQPVNLWFFYQIGIGRKDQLSGAKRPDDQLIGADRNFEEPTSYWLSAFFFPQGEIVF